MTSRRALETSQDKDGKGLELMLKLTSGEGDAVQEAGVVRGSDGKYAIAIEEEGEAVLRPLDEFGNTPTQVTLSGNQVDVNYEPAQQSLSVILGTDGEARTQVTVTFNN